MLQDIVDNVLAQVLWSSLSGSRASASLSFKECERIAGIPKVAVTKRDLRRGNEPLELSPSYSSTYRVLLWIISIVVNVIVAKQISIGKHLVGTGQRESYPTLLIERQPVRLPGRNSN